MQTKLRSDRMAETITPMMNRIAEDEELRAHVKTALDSARKVYKKIQEDGPRRAAGRREVHDEVLRAANELTQSARRLSAKPQKTHKLRNMLFATALVVGAIAGARKLLGSDGDEFDYEP